MTHEGVKQKCDLVSPLNSTIIPKGSSASRARQILIALSVSFMGNATLLGCKRQLEPYHNEQHSHNIHVLLNRLFIYQLSYFLLL